jgi:hypothetical protein
LAAILGEKAAGLSATNIVRLKASWEADYQAWRQRDLSQKQYVYWWADGVYFNVRLEDARTCAPPTPSNRPSLPSDFGRNGPKGAARGSRR